MRRLFHNDEERARLLDHLHDAARPRIDQYGSIVDHGVSIIPDSVFRRHVIIGHASFRKFGSDDDVTLIAVRRPVLLDNITAETRALINAKHASHAANDASDRTAHDGSDRAGGSLAFARTAFNATGNTLGGGGQWHND